ncbi:MAG: class I SAM-dependent methyltransferase [Bacillus sp. (in: firmicutes)]
MIQRWLGNQLRKPAGILSKQIGAYMQKGNDEINRWTVDLLDPKSGEAVLEVGIGNGSTLERVLRTADVVSVCGVDISASMIKEAGKRLRSDKEEGRVTLKEGDIHSLPCEDSSFDKVFSVHTIYFWDDIQKGISEIHRVLKPNGKLFLSITDSGQLERMKRAETFALYKTEDIVKRLADAHFQGVTVHHKKAYRCIEAQK